VLSSVVEECRSRDRWSEFGGSGGRGRADMDGGSGEWVRTDVMYGDNVTGVRNGGCSSLSRAIPQCKNDA
jgi:hypothetical protein